MVQKLVSCLDALCLDLCWIWIPFFDTQDIHTHIYTHTNVCVYLKTSL
jgi:hypothetical protein